MCGRRCAASQADVVAVTWALGFSLFRNTGRAVGSVHAA